MLPAPAQPGTPSTTAETLKEIQECIRAADARNSSPRRRKNDQEQRKFVANLVNHIQGVPTDTANWAD